MEIYFATLTGCTSFAKLLIEHVEITARYYKAKKCIHKAVNKVNSQERSSLVVKVWMSSV